MKTYLIILFTCLGINTMLSQDSLYVFTLKSGDVLNGKIISTSGIDSITIETNHFNIELSISQDIQSIISKPIYYGNNEISNTQDSIISAQKELLKVLTKQSEEISRQKEYDPIYNKHYPSPVWKIGKGVIAEGRSINDSSEPQLILPKSKGLYGTLSYGMLFGRNSFGSRINSSIHFGMGYKFNQKYMFHIGSGFDFVEGASMPFYFESQRYFNVKNFSLYGFANVGYNLYFPNWMMQREGQYYSAGIGTKKHINGEKFWGYRFEYRYVEQTEDHQNWIDGTSFIVSSKLHRLGFRLTYNF